MELLDEGLQFRLLLRAPGVLLEGRLVDETDTRNKSRSEPSASRGREGPALRAGLGPGAGRGEV